VGNRHRQTSESYAVIEDTKLRKQTLYRVNDTVQNATVKEIHREKVILDVDGAYEVLEMEKIISASASTSDRHQLPRHPGQTTIRPVEHLLKREKSKPL
jgi:type II secretory pathway component PulC